jgi:thiol-disulfide isomerase/thioredoxin
LLLFGVASVLTAVTTTAARGQVTVGQPVEFKLQTLEGKTLSPKELKGKVVLLDFWATWCPPCREQVPHMVKLNEEYEPKGLQIIGVSLDRSIGDMKPFVAQNKMSWQHAFDGKRTLSKQFGVSGIPHVALFSPDGVLRWTGHPANLDKHLQEVFEKYPPEVVDEKTQRESQAAAALGEAEKLRAARKHEQAYAAFKQVAKTSAGTPAGDKAAAAVKQYESDPAFAKKQADKEAGGKAKAALGVARGYASSGKTDAAIKKYQSIIADYPKSEWAKTAETEMAKLK